MSGMHQETSPELWLDLADPEDGVQELGRLKDFLERHPSTNLSPRPDEQFEKAIGSSYSFRVQTRPTLTTSDSRDIAAQASVFERRDGKVFEIGAINVAPDHQGMRLQTWLMRVAIRHLFDVEGLAGRTDWMIYAAVAEDNIASWKNIEAAGMVRAPPNHAVWREIGKTPDEVRALEKRIYVFPGAAEAANAADLVGLARSGRPRPEVSATLGFAHRLRRFTDSHYLKDLERIAATQQKQGTDK